MPASNVRRSINGFSRKQTASQALGAAGRGETGSGPSRNPPCRLEGSLAESAMSGARASRYTRCGRFETRLRGVETTGGRQACLVLGPKSCLSSS